ncbi:MAG: radical SAM family heme chaperone HemW, partial [Proteobacteria bacterium]|nr:radical SAM family heme chaperone HemW [Pseudomonadota bacterium]
EVFDLKNCPVDTIYFGGGTPSLMTPDDIDALLHEISSAFILEDRSEITLEVNPATADNKKLPAFRKVGINRLSIGVQSFQAGNLNFLGRLHNADEAQICIQNAKEAGFENISLDFIYGLPGQTVNDLLSDLKKAVHTEPQHLSLYMLTLEQDTPLYLRAKKGQFIPMEDKRQEDLFNAATNYLGTREFIRYETSNYAKKGYQSRHNLKYWNGDNYLGFGAAAHSYLQEFGWGLRWWNVSDTDKYISCLNGAKMPIDEIEMLSRRSALMETVFTSLRTVDGLQEDYLLKRFGITLGEAVSLPAIDNCPDNLLIIEKDRLRLTDKGALLADELTAHIIN